VFFVCPAWRKKILVDVGGEVLAEQHLRLRANGDGASITMVKVLVMRWLV
jgi:hypothetical protein